MRHIQLSFCAVFALLASAPAMARPEYATKEKINCNACHVTPWGGGPRMVFGKVYGSRDQGLGKVSSTDLVYADVRAIAYYPTEDTASTVNGVALMEAAVTGNVPIIQGDRSSEMRGVLTFNMAPLSGAQVREAYLRFQLPTDHAADPTLITVGRFYAPFGLLTDEHRTYTRIQTNSTINNYDVGVALSGNFSHELHYDVVVVNDFQSGGNFTADNLTWATVGNIRWNPDDLPFMLGASANFERILNQPDPYAFSLYGGLSLDRITHNKISGSLILERVNAYRWNNPTVNTGQINPGFNAFFFSPADAAYQNSVRYASSLGYYFQVRYNVRRRLALLYKWDYLTPQLGGAGAFTRNGFGFEVYPNSNVIIQAKYEVAGVPDAISPEDPTLAAQDNVYLMLRVWL